ncbi:carbamoyltransferase HypF [Abyssisolibacter fermentans]|uniref:carbamoyltransferase HypF n=1 Tax=Abyssisolibacter fermentans TaxID=1766203 RepID=UPI0030843A15
MTVKGIVQGVGFRPFVYKTAVNNNLTGWVKNTSKGVYIDVEGKKSDISKFIYAIYHKSPPISEIKEINIEEKEMVNYKNFEIKHSIKEEDAVTFISPDIGICAQCLEDIKDINNRRYKYPFTNCTNCGPRFSIIKKLPYDRNSTAMDEFEMCSICKSEYDNLLDRRFHAQPNACTKCGPKVELIDNFGNRVLCDDPIKQAVKLIKQGKIILVKGLGGFQITCDAVNEKTIEKLRDKKHRPAKPLALMMKNIKVVKKYCKLSEKEEKVILSSKKPIILLEKKLEILPNNIAPNSNKLGVMLPYTPLHSLIFEEDIEVLVMTSGNISSYPMIYKNEEALNRLNNIVDFFLLHNRKIHVPVDDSVCKVILGEENVIRSARGYAPIYIKQNVINILACGSHLKNTFALSKNNYIIMSQYIGDIENIETFNCFERSLNHLKNIYNIKPKIIAYDMHPNYWSFEYTKKQDIKKVQVQHHHAHIVSCMVENKVKDKIIGIAYDGIGYGMDGKMWGSEFLICDYKDFIRVGHVDYVNMPGGDFASKEPWKIAVSYLYKAYRDDIYEKLPYTLINKNIKPILYLIKNNINSPQCCSIGKLFDAVSAILGFIGKVTFEGEAAILLENIADKNECSRYDYDIEYINQKYIVNTDNMIIGITNDLKNHVNYKIISKKMHNTVIDFSIETCKMIAKKYNIYKVALSGGVFQNEILLKGIYKKLVSKGFMVYTHKLIPCNDSGISLGQLVIADAKSKE